MNSKILIVVYIIISSASAFAGCTIALATADATSDSKPIIFKNRDISNWNLEFKVLTPGGYYAHACNTNYGSSTTWMGVNEVGFGIVQSAAYNISWSGGSGLGNGTLMAFALKNCITVADFEDILDSTDVTGRSTGANYAVIDASGGAAMFECDNWAHQRYDPDSLGLVVRANFAYIGSAERDGIERYERAYDLMAQAVIGNYLDAEFIATNVINDLYRVSENPYPLPWTGSFHGLPNGWVDTDWDGDETINNEQTHCAGIVNGPPVGSSSDNAVLWCFFGTPVLTIPFPLFPASHSQPPQAVGSPAEMCELAHAKYDSAFSYPSHETWLNTAFLLDELGDGVLEYILPSLDWAFDTVAIQLAEWISSPPTAEQRAEFQDSIMAKIIDAYTSGVPVAIEEVKIPDELAMLVYPNPFNSSVCISVGQTFVSIPASEQAGMPILQDEIEIFDLSGKCVKVFDKMPIVWQPEEEISSGIYLIRAAVGERTITKRVVYLK